MRRFLIAAAIAVPCITSNPVGAASYVPYTSATSQPRPVDGVYPLMLATGALVGVAAVNILTYGIGTLPLSASMVSTAQIISPAAAAASRIFVITSGVFGAWIADALYPRKSE